MGMVRMRGQGKRRNEHDNPAGRGSHHDSTNNSDEGVAGNETAPTPATQLLIGWIMGGTMTTVIRRA
jgi:hypothetical protein